MGVGEEEGILVLLALVHSPLAGLGHLMPMKQESQGASGFPDLKKERQDGTQGYTMSSQGTSLARIAHHHDFYKATQKAASQ